MQKPGKRHDADKSQEKTIPPANRRNQRQGQQAANYQAMYNTKYSCRPPGTQSPEKTTQYSAAIHRMHRNQIEHPLHRAAEGKLRKKTAQEEQAETCRRASRGAEKLCPVIQRPRMNLRAKAPNR